MSAVKEMVRFACLQYRLLSYSIAWVRFLTVSLGFVFLQYRLGWIVYSIDCVLVIFKVCFLDNVCICTGF